MKAHRPTYASSYAGAEYLAGITKVALTAILIAVIAFALNFAYGLSTGE